MEENIIAIIEEAEARAAEEIAAAREEAARIAVEAQQTASLIVKDGEAACRRYLEEALREAEAQAEEAYSAFVAESRRAAEEYANGILEGANASVGEIVGRLLK